MLRVLRTPPAAFAFRTGSQRGACPPPPHGTTASDCEVGRGPRLFTACQVAGWLRPVYPATTAARSTDWSGGGNVAPWFGADLKRREGCRGGAERKAARVGLRIAAAARTTIAASTRRRPGPARQSAPKSRIVCRFPLARLPRSERWISPCSRSVESKSVRWRQSGPRSRQC